MEVVGVSSCSQSPACSCSCAWNLAVLPTCIHSQICQGLLCVLVLLCRDVFPPPSCPLSLLSIVLWCSLVWRVFPSNCCVSSHLKWKDSEGFQQKAECAVLYFWVSSEERLCSHMSVSHHWELLCAELIVTKDWNVSGAQRTHLKCAFASGQDIHMYTNLGLSGHVALTALGFQWAVGQTHSCLSQHPPYFVRRLRVPIPGGGPGHAGALSPSCTRSSMIFKASSNQSRSALLLQMAKFTALVTRLWARLRRSSLTSGFLSHRLLGRFKECFSQSVFSHSARCVTEELAARALIWIFVFSCFVSCRWGGAVILCTTLLILFSVR